MDDCDTPFSVRGPANNGLITMPPHQPGNGGEQRQETFGPARQVAISLLELQPPEEIAARLDAIARGRDPDAEPGQGHEPIDWSLRWKAQLEVINRTLGKVTERVRLEGEIRQNVEARIAVFAVDPRDVDGVLGAGEAEIYRQAQRKLVAFAKQKVNALAAVRRGREDRFASGAPRIVDAAWQEVPPDGRAK